MQEYRSRFSDVDTTRTLGPDRRCLWPCCIVTRRRRHRP